MTTRIHAVLKLYGPVPLVLASAATPDFTYGEVSEELRYVRLCVCVCERENAKCMPRKGRGTEQTRQRQRKKEIQNCGSENVCVCSLCVLSHLCVFAIRQCVYILKCADLIANAL